MRVALLVNEYITENSFAGGLANYTYRVAQGLKQLGHEPIVMVLASESETLWHEGVQVRRVQAYLPHWLRASRRAGGKFIKLPFRAVRKLRHLRNQLAAEPLDQAQVDHLNVPTLTLDSVESALYFLASGFGMQKALKELHQESPIDVAHYTHLMGLGAFRLNIPSVVRLSSYRDLWVPYNFQFTSRIERILEDMALRRANRVIGPSTWVANYVTQKLGIPVQVIESPFVPPQEPEDPTIFEQAVGAEVTYGLYFGSLAEWKGVFVLAEALEEFLQQHPHYSFVFVGRNITDKAGLPASEYLRQRLSAYANRVKILDKLRHPQLFPIIRGAEFVALPSLAENFPNACLESMWLERVTIGTRDRSFDQLIDHGQNGLLCEPDDVNSLSGALATAAALSNEQRAKMGADAKKRIQQLRPEQVVAELLKVYESVRTE